MHWIYILKCKDDHYYVGETTRLYRRFWEHSDGRGGLNTSIYTPEKIVSLYKVSKLGKFLEYNNNVVNNIYNIYFKRCNLLENFNYEDNDEYDHLLIENDITECLMINNKHNWKKIRGGQYIRFDTLYNFPKNENIKNLPLCHCGLPCDIHKNEKQNYLYFRCAKKNFWDDIKEEFDIKDEPCKYFMKYNKGIDYEKYWDINKKIIRNLTSKSLWLEQLIGGTYQFCIGGCGKEFDGDNTIRYLRSAINLCFDCFINKYDELSKKYNKCLIISC